MAGKRVSVQITLAKGKNRKESGLATAEANLF